ncbi:NAD(P)-binding protein [bacterium]|nr:NAD(P)-binding protein [bacterium]
MPRSPSFALARRLVAAARLRTGGAPVARALSRRGALALIAAGMTSGMTACAPPAAMRRPRSSRPVVIVGGGAAGLTAAYRLAQSGRRADLYESSGRTGGRMFTLRDFTSEGQFCELGGEFVDTHHTALMSLAAELGVGIERLRPEGGSWSDAFLFGGEIRSSRDLVDPEAGVGGFLPIASRIAIDQADLLDANDEWTPRAIEIDRTPLSDYLGALRGEAPDWVLDFLAIAYTCEFGLPPEQQSALNLVDFISADPASEFAPYGESDQAWRIAGGSSSLTEALDARLRSEFASSAAIHSRHELTAIERSSSGFALTFRSPDGVVTVGADEVVLALPFTRLKSVENLGGIGLSAPKMRAINELGYGANAKLMVATTSRPWTDGSLFGRNTGFSGSFYSDLPFQSGWETSLGQPGRGGVLTNFLAADPARGEEAAALDHFAGGLRELSPAMADSLDLERKASFFWPRHPHTLASYSAAKVGQYTSLLEIAAAPEFSGMLHFAGEHTSVDFQGYMNGAVESGERVAAALLAG